jgi:peroxiredoxin
MSRRNTYLLGGLAAAAGLAMLVFAIVALTSGDDDSTSDRGAQERPTARTPSPPGGATGTDGETKRDSSEPSAVNARGAAIQRALARRRPVKAPDLSAEILQRGSIPLALRGPFERAESGGRLDISRLRGTPIVLHLSSSRCAPCRPDTVLVRTTWNRWGPRGVLFVGVSVKEPPGAAKAVLRQYDVTYPVVLDRDGEIAKRYGATALPHTFFISSGGNIVGEVAGSPSVRQLEVGTSAAKSGDTFGSEQGTSRIPIQ